MRVYKCKVEYERTGVTVYDGQTFDKDIYVRANSVKQALEKAKHYREKEEVKKVTEVWSVEFMVTIDKE